MPLLLLLAVGVVLAERLRLGRRSGYAVVAASLLLCVGLSGFAGVRLTGPAGASAGLVATPEAGAGAPFALPALRVAPAEEPTATPGPLPSSTARAVAQRQPPTPTPTPTSVPTATATVATPHVTPTAQAVQAAQVAVTVAPVAPTALPPTPTPAPPRGTTVIPILMYHYVRVVTDPKDTLGINLSVRPDLFAQQMQYLADHGYTTLTMREVYAILAGELPLPERPIALTFDDGYRDFYTAAWPVLRKHGFKATNYVIAGYIGWDAYLTWEMLQELDASGLVEIGAHTMVHGDLRAFDQERRWREIAGSKATLEQGLGHPVTAFCYPAGKYNADVAAQVRQAGYLTATTVEYGVRQNLQWAYALPRVRVHGPDSLATWVGKLPK